MYRPAAGAKSTIQQLSRRMFKSYMVSLVYAEQFSNAFIHYNEFLSLSTQWNFTGVEPFVINSRISGFQTLYPDSIDIRQLLDMELFHDNYLECVGGKRRSLIETMDSFLQNSFREIVVVYFSGHMNVLPRNIHKSMDSSLVNLFASHNDTAIVTCTKLAVQSLTPAIRDILNKEQLKSGNRTIPKREQFIVREVFCVNRAVPLSLRQLMDHLVDYLHSTKLEASVLFVSWQGKFTRAFTDLATMRSCVLPFTQVPFSSTVMNSAEKFRQSKGLLPNNYISLHIRFGKLIEYAFIERKSNESGYYSCCMKRLEQTLKELSNKTNIPLNHTLFLNDFSDHGTDACVYNGHWKPSHVCRERTNEMVSMLSVNASEFDPSSYNLGVDNTGFVSLVEQASLFEGRVLVTVGTGNFQSGLIGRFAHHHRNSTTGLHYRLCINEKLNGLKINSPVC